MRFEVYMDSVPRRMVAFALPIEKHFVGHIRKLGQSPDRHGMNHHSRFALLILMLGAAGLVHGEDDAAHWIDADSGCKVFAAHPAADLKVSWSGACENGYAEGEG